MGALIRAEVPSDFAAIREINRLAFGRDGEARLVDDLRAGGYSRVSLIAEVGGLIVGHILLGDLPILTTLGTVHALSLAPMAVVPSHQRKGIGSSLVGEGLRTCREAGHRVVVVLGHSEFY